MKQMILSLAVLCQFSFLFLSAAHAEDFMDYEAADASGSAATTESMTTEDPNAAAGTQDPSAAAKDTSGSESTQQQAPQQSGNGSGW
jgi:hypothetical protein